MVVARDLRDVDDAGEEGDSKGVFAPSNAAAEGSLVEGVEEDGVGGVALLLLLLLSVVVDVRGISATWMLPDHHSQPSATFSIPIPNSSRKAEERKDWAYSSKTPGRGLSLLKREIYLIASVMCVCMNLFVPLFLCK